MSLIILSSSESESNFVLSCFINHPSYKATYYLEDKLLFKRNIQYPKKYLTLSDVKYCNDYTEFKNFMLKNTDCKMFFVIRHPYDWILSKVYKKRPIKSKGRIHTIDEVVNICFSELNKMYDIYNSATLDFAQQILTVKIEGVLIDIDNGIRKLCEWLEVPYYQPQYGDKKDVALYKNVDTVFNGYFKHKEKIINKMFDGVQYWVKELNYRT